MTEAEYKQKFDNLVNVMWDLQRRICELEEFENQWNAIFDRLKERTGFEQSINILGSEIFSLYRWDKYQILVTDLLSALENEYQNENSVCRQTIDQLEIHPVEFYIDSERKINFLYLPDFPKSEDDEKKRAKQIIDDQARDLRLHCITALGELFPEMLESTNPSADDIDKLQKKIKKLRDEIYSARQAFAHKNQELITKKHSRGLEKTNLKQIRRVANEFFDVIKKIGFIKYHASYGTFFENSFKRQVQDQIDLILFGSISGVHMRYYPSGQNETYYSDAREKYYDSEDFLKIIAKTKSPVEKS